MASPMEKQAYLDEIARRAGTERFPEEIKQTYARARDKAREAREEQRRETRGKVSELSGVPEYKKGGKVGSASKRADGIAQRGKTKGRMI